MCSGAQQRSLTVISSVVDHEWRIRAPEVMREVQRHFAEIESQSSSFHDACKVLGLKIDFGRATYAKHGVAERLHALSEQLLQRSVCLAENSATKTRAFDRILSNVPPSNKGGEVKDCAILEDYLEICRKVRELGFEGKMIFCTSNKTDFCLGSRPHPNLARDYANVRLTFTSNLPWAVHELKT
jgi:hypothetical protein